MKPILGFILAALGTGFAIVFLRRLSPALGLVDQPGGRKEHDLPVPLVGGLGIFVAFVGTAIALGMGIKAGYFCVALAVIIVVGLIDDLNELRPIPKFAAQIVACIIMIFGAGVQLKTVGNLMGFGPIGLSFLWVPAGVFAVVGVINAVNMIDGLDGLAGSVSLIAVVAFAAVAALSGLEAQFHVLVIFAGTLLAFLYFNMRYSSQPHAVVFLGDAGSMLLGFSLAWFAIDLTQGPGRTFPPICALWIVVIPLCDTVSLLVRRIHAGKSPVIADREHVHHLLLAHGFTATQTVWVLIFASIVTAFVGVGGWLLEIPQPLLFFAFVVLFAGYHLAAKRQWERLYAATDNAAST